MARKYHPISASILKYLNGFAKPVAVLDIKTSCCTKLSTKNFYNYLFRLEQQELIAKVGKTAQITEQGRKLLKHLLPEKDGVWKLVIFDIPEKHKYVRSVLR